MFSLSKINLRRITTVFLLSITLFFSVALIGNTPAIAAEAITRDATKGITSDVVSDAEYEADKASRQQKQAMRSKQAEERAELENENKTISEKLNLNESLPRSTKKLGEQIAGDEPINNETRP